MNYEECLEYIHSVNWTFCKPGLERIRTLCDALGNPERELKFIHVAGTNGKGSFCAMMSSVLIEQGYKDVMEFDLNANDTVIGITASGGAPYVLGTLQAAKDVGAFCSSITCNESSAVASASDIPMVAVVGPEFVTGSTRMKAGTATKLILNMVSTSVMIRLGHVIGNKMVDMQLTNKKLVDRGTRMIMEQTGITDYDYAKSLLLKHGQVRAAVDHYMTKKTGDL